MPKEPILMRLARLVSHPDSTNVHLQTHAPGGLTNLPAASPPEDDPNNDEAYRSTQPLSHNAGDPLRRRGDF